MSADQPKVERMLRIMQMLSGSVSYTIDEIAERLEMSRRTIYRYIETLKDVGFVVGKVHDDQYRIFSMGPGAPDFDKLICFSPEEAYIVNSLIDRLDSTNTLKGNLKRKLATIYDSTSLADFVDRKDNAAIVETLSEAIKSRKKAILKGYESGSTLTKSDRLVEPFAFTTNYVEVWAYELATGLNKVFKISRIDSVDLLPEDWTEEQHHHSSFEDVFRMTGDPLEKIVLRMTALAKNLLLEEFPMSEKDIRPDGDTWILETDIAAVYGAGRFVMGLAADVEILEGDILKDYVRAMVESFLAEI